MGDESAKFFHHFQKSIEEIALPKQFTFPFSYEPHQLSVMATDEVLRYITAQSAWHKELSLGKMFGVLVARNQRGDIGFFAAFSGQIAGSYQHSYFVPPVYDLSQPGGFFREEERAISTINQEVESILQSETYLRLCRSIETQKSFCEQLTLSWKQRLEEAKAKRDHMRSEGVSTEEEAALIRESQFMKAEFKRERQAEESKLETLRRDLEVYEQRIAALKQERKSRSAQLQNRLFDQFVFYNAEGDKDTLCGIFRRATLPVPPSGAGECAAPKLLQYAYLHCYQPLCMAEFWWGESPKSIVRVHGHYYSACKSKCEPILQFMLQGLDVEPSPLINTPVSLDLEIVWEDASLLILRKPHGVLSVPGKSSAPSVLSFVRERYPEATGPMVVHRLDMATSGLLMVAKTKEVHCALQKQFENHTIKKEYVAWLEGVLPQDEGDIVLPICPDVEHRPCQMVSEKYGKYAETHYEVVERRGDRTKVFFYPKTGRTHQLRLHAAHVLGLNAPIVGDELYGTKSDRLYLQARKIEFVHPITHRVVIVEIPSEF